jgi:16S rRNA (cytidine1402-2'-O)-methyltransferase
LEWLSRVAEIKHTVTFFEAPHRIVQTLSEAGRILGERPIMLGRELTKVHQEFIRGDSIADIVGRMTESRGEFTVVLGPEAVGRPRQAVVTDDEIASAFGQMLETGAGSRRSAVSALAKRFGRSSRDVYAIIERAKNR